MGSRRAMSDRPKDVGREWLVMFPSVSNSKSVYIRLLEWKDGGFLGRANWETAFIAEYHYPMSSEGWLNALADEKRMDNCKENKKLEYPSRLSCLAVMYDDKYMGPYTKTTG